MPNPRFSVVIPTRNRHTTLKYALLTCLNQKNFDDYEIIVCDNCSSPETRETVESFESEKIKYIRSDRPLAMSQNWELAVSHAEGEYVIVIGDDDGLLLSAFSKIDKLLKLFDIKLLRWEYIYYSWPNYPITKNKILLPLIRENRIWQSREVISKVGNSRMYFGNLPMIYNSAVHKDLINLLTEKTGKIFASQSPDVYSGFAFAYLAESYASIGLPMSICGASASSNGTSSINSPIFREFRALNEKANITCHLSIPDIHSISAEVADSFMYAKEELFPRDKDLYIDRKRLIYNSINQMRLRYIQGLDREEIFWDNMNKVRDSLSYSNHMQKWFDKTFHSPLTDPLGPNKFFRLLERLNKRFSTTNSEKVYDANQWNKGFNGGDLVLDASELGIENVFQMAEFSEKIYDANIDKLEWSGLGLKAYVSKLLINTKHEIAKRAIRY